MTPAIESIVGTELPDANQIINSGRAIGLGLQLGRTDFCKAMGVHSEADYKRQVNIVPFKGAAVRDPLRVPKPAKHHRISPNAAEECNVWSARGQRSSYC